jgi:hypothetical protein
MMVMMMMMMMMMMMITVTDDHRDHARASDDMTVMIRPHPGRSWSSLAPLADRDSLQPRTVLGPGYDPCY